MGEVMTTHSGLALATAPIIPEVAPLTAAYVTCNNIRH